LKSSFVVPLKKWGNSYVLKVPPAIAKLYKLGNDVRVTIEHTEISCERCGSIEAVIETRKGEVVCERCLDEEAQNKRM